MSPRQRPIPVTDRERRFLEEQRKVYEDKIGKSTDWGEFLRAAALLGLVGLGVYVLVNAAQGAGQSVTVTCTRCGSPFMMVVPQEAERYVQVSCPQCSTGLVVDLAGVSAIP